MRRQLAALGASVCIAWLSPNGALADPMGQGEAAINVRSDVKLGIKGTGGTPSERLSKLGQAVGDQMGEIRGCYRKLVASAPELAGGLQLKLTLAEGAKPLVEVTQTQGGAGELVQCVSKVLRGAPYTDVGRPAAAFLKLEFDNSRAKGELEMNARQADLARVDVVAGPDGTKQASWSTQGAEVTFTVSAPASAPDEAVELVMRGFHEGYAAFLDCRRKCEKGGTSPEGDIEAELQIDRRGKPRVKLGAVTVAHARAPACSTRAFMRSKFEKPAAPIQARVRVHFAE